MANGKALLMDLWFLIIQSILTPMGLTEIEMLKRVAFFFTTSFSIRTNKCETVLLKNNFYPSMTVTFPEVSPKQEYLSPISIPWSIMFSNKHKDLIYYTANLWQIILIIPRFQYFVWLFQVVKRTRKKLMNWFWEKLVTELQINEWKEIKA